jgi:hypothetical protein
MKSNTIIIGLLVILVLAVGAWYIFAPHNPSAGMADSMATSTVATSTTSGTTNTTTTSTQATTLRALATQGGNYTCTLNTISAASQTRGTLYSAGGKTRLDFVSKNSQDVDTTVHIIRMGGYSYTWVDGQPGGVKAAITASSPIVTQPQGGNIIVTDTAQLSSSCRPWVPDPTEFTPPASIVFVAP